MPLAILSSLFNLRIRLFRAAQTTDKQTSKFLSHLYHLLICALPVHCLCTVYLTSRLSCCMGEKQSLLQVIKLVSKVTPRVKTPIILFQYYNPILRKGPDEYCRIAKQAGAAGNLVTHPKLFLADNHQESRIQVFLLWDL